MITSTSNEKIKHVALLIKSAKARREEGAFVVEGERIASEVPQDILEECFVTEDRIVEGGIRDVFPYDVTPTVVSEAVFKKMSDTKSPQGILCVCRKRTVPLEELLASKKDGPLKLLVLERIQDPGNLGTMIRTAEGAGFDAIIADEGTADVYNPKVTRSTMGSLFRIPVIYTSDLLYAADMLKDHSVTIYAAHLNGETDYRKARYGDRVAFLIGNEGNGLSDEISGRADMLVKIPMQGKLESLNAAVAAALLMYNVQ